MTLCHISKRGTFQLRDRLLAAESGISRLAIPWLGLPKFARLYLQLAPNPCANWNYGTCKIRSPSSPHWNPATCSLKRSEITPWNLAAHRFQHLLIKHWNTTTCTPRDSLVAYWNLTTLSWRCIYKVHWNLKTHTSCAFRDLNWNCRTPKNTLREALINTVFQEVGADFSVLLRQIGVSRADIAISRLPPTFRTQLGCQVPTTNGEPAPNLPGQTG
jgi:hypothetical protein